MGYVPEDGMGWLALLHETEIIISIWLICNNLVFFLFVYQIPEKVIMQAASGALNVTRQLASFSILT